MGNLRGMKSKPSKGNRVKVTAWADRIRKLKPQMNALTHEERERLLAETLRTIDGAAPALTHARRR